MSEVERGVGVGDPLLDVGEDTGGVGTGGAQGSCSDLHEPAGAWAVGAAVPQGAGQGQLELGPHVLMVGAAGVERQGSLEHGDRVGRGAAGDVGGAEVEEGVNLVRQILGSVRKTIPT